MQGDGIIHFLSYVCFQHIIVYIYILSIEYTYTCHFKKKYILKKIENKKKIQRKSPSEIKLNVRFWASLFYRFI